VAKVGSHVGANTGVDVVAKVGPYVSANTGVDIVTKVGAHVGANTGVDIVTEVGAHVGANTSVDIMAEVGADIGANTSVDIVAKVGANISPNIGAHIGLELVSETSIGLLQLLALQAGGLTCRWGRRTSNRDRLRIAVHIPLTDLLTIGCKAEARRNSEDYGNESSHFETTKRHFVFSSPRGTF
jgi:hypothetical protein